MRRTLVARRPAPVFDNDHLLGPPVPHRWWLEEGVVREAFAWWEVRTYRQPEPPEGQGVGVMHPDGPSGWLRAIWEEPARRAAPRRSRGTTRSGRRGR